MLSLAPPIEKLKAEYIPFTRDEEENRKALMLDLSPSLEPWIAGIATPGGELLKLLQPFIPPGCYVSGVELFEHGANFFVKENRYVASIGFIRVRPIGDES